MPVRVFRHPRIHVCTERGPVEAVAVRSGVVVAAGSQAQVRQVVGSGAELVDLEGEAVLPGLVDSHIHGAMFSRDIGSLDLRSATSSRECARRLAEFVARTPGDDWVFGGRWDANLWGAGDVPQRAVLDEVCPRRPVALMSSDCHTMWANSAALAAAGIDETTPDPAGGRIARDASGAATGLLLEAAAHRLQDIEQSPAAGDLVAHLRRGQRHLLSVGVTSVRDFDGDDAWVAYRRLHEAGELRVRVRKSIPAASLEDAIAQGRRTGDGDDWLATGPVKIFGDGALGSHTCHMSHDFVGEPGNAGICVTPPHELDRLITVASRAGIAVATHAIGDRANTAVVDAYERTRAQWEGRFTPSIEHVQHLSPRDVPRLAALGLIASMQPAHAPSDIDLVESLLAGRELVSYGWASLLAAGVPVAFGSDAPVDSPDPFVGLAAAMSRTRADGTPAGGWQPQERVSARQALRAYTSDAARVVGGPRVGRLVEGCLADLVAVERDPLVAAPEQVRNTRVLATYVGGDLRYESSHR